MSDQVIPEAAIEAAKEAMHRAALSVPAASLDSYARAALEAALPQLLAEATRLIGDLTDRADCWFDHHGGCQAHGYLDLQPPETCPQLDAKAWAHNHGPTP